MWLIVLLNWHFCDFLLYLPQSKYEDQGNFPVFAAGQHSFGLFLLMAPLSRCWSTPGEILSQISRLTCAVNICAGALVSGWPNMASWPEAPTTGLYWTLPQVRRRRMHCRQVVYQQSSSTGSSSGVVGSGADTPHTISYISQRAHFRISNRMYSCFEVICEVLFKEIKLCDFDRFFGKPLTYHGSVRLPQIEIEPI